MFRLQLKGTQTALRVGRGRNCWQLASMAWSPASCSLFSGVCVVCLSLRPFAQVLKKYPCLWCMTKPPSRRPKLYIVNLQVTCCLEAPPSPLGCPAQHSRALGG